MEFEASIDASKGLVTVKGDKEFVVEMIEKLKGVFEGYTAVPPPSASAPTPAPSPGGAAAASPQVSGSLDSLSNVFDVNGDEISIIADIPGSTQAAKAKNIALLYLLARLKMGQQSVDNESIREQCKAHAVYDSTNFATQMKSQKKLVTASGAKGSPNFTLKLTVPGKKAAEELAAELQKAG